MSRRNGYTFLELVGAMAASSLLLLALASTVAIATALVEPTDENGQQSRDRMLLNRLSQDLRFANGIDSTQSGQLAVERFDSVGRPMSLAYEAQGDGIIRQVVSGPRVVLDPQTPSLAHHIDGFSAATSTGTVMRPRVRDVSVAVTDGTGEFELQIDVPVGARPGDLLLLVTAYRSAIFILPTTPGWVIGNWDWNINVSVISHWQLMTASTPQTHQILFNPGAGVAAAMLAIENANQSWPFGWSDTQVGTSTAGSPSTYPQAIENPDSFPATTLNLQFYAASGTPVPTRSLGVASFVDCVNLLASPSDTSECSLGIAFRTGPMPPLTVEPRVLHQRGENWVSVGVEVEGNVE